MADNDNEDDKRKKLDSLKKFSSFASDLIPTSVNNEAPLARIKNTKWKQLVYSPTALMQLSLPHEDPGNISTWKVRNGEADILLRSGSLDDDKGRSSPTLLPYGWFPRFLLLWIQFHVQNTQERDIFFGRSFAQMLERVLQLGRQTSNYKNVKTQFPRLLHYEMEVHQHYPAIDVARGLPFQGEGEHVEFHRFVRGYDRFTDQKKADKKAFRIYLSESFYTSILTNPLSINMDHVRKLVHGGNTYNIDMYTFLCERLHLLEEDKPLHVVRSDIEDLFGTNVSDRGKFYRDNFLKEIVPAVKEVYPEANLSADKDGLTLYKSPPPCPATQKIESDS
ncbi:MAG: replication protein RepA [Pseudomonadota bacterium]|nr:replication protein RepA [Pseudomonadota bacterium]